MTEDCVKNIKCFLKYNVREFPGWFGSLPLTCYVYMGIGASLRKLNKS